MRLSKQRGIAVATALATMVVLATVATLVVARAIGELRNGGDDAAIVQTLLAARGGANLGGAVLAGPVRAALDPIVNSTSSTTGPWSYGDGSGVSPSPTSVAIALAGVAGRLQAEIDNLLCGRSVPLAASGTLVEVRVHVTATACGRPLPRGAKLPVGRFVAGQPRDGAGLAAAQSYALPFVMLAEASTGPYRRNVVLQGEYRFDVGRSSFARYALFTNAHTTPAGNEIWFTGSTLFDGPVHTNERFRYYRDPWFGGEVTSAGCSAAGTTGCAGPAGAGAFLMAADGSRVDFLAPDRMAPSPSAPQSNGTAPRFADGVDWNASFVPLPSNAQDQRAQAQANGLFISDNLQSLELFAADSNGTLPAWSQSAGRWLPTATFQYVRACAEAPAGVCTTYRYGADNVLYRSDASAAGWVPARTAFNGVVFVEGRVERLRGPTRNPAGSLEPSAGPPAIASFSQMTLATQGRVRVTGDLRYENPPCAGSPTAQQDRSVQRADCANQSARNVFGIYSESADIMVGNNNADASLNAPDNVEINGVLMSGRGIVGVENYDRGVARGDVRVLGGVIEYNYGAFGTFNSLTGAMSTGFGRRFTYDQRMRAGVAPPYFPTTGNDGVRSVRLFSFGQREQVY